jgi:hypothetical protein
MFLYSFGNIQTGGSNDCDVRNQKSNGINTKSKHQTKRVQILKISPG